MHVCSIFYVFIFWYEREISFLFEFAPILSEASGVYSKAHISFIYSYTWERVEVGDWGQGEECKGAVSNICQHLHSPNKLTLHNSVYVLPSMVSGSL